MMTDYQTKVRGSGAVSEQEFNYQLATFIPFRDLAHAKRDRRITKQEITRHPNPNFRISVIEDPSEFYFQFSVRARYRVPHSGETGP